MRETVSKDPIVLDKSEADFVNVSVELPDETFREVMGDFGHEFRSGKQIGDFLHRYNRRGHIVTDTGNEAEEVPVRHVRFSSKLFLMVANAALNYVSPMYVSTVELMGLHSPGGEFGKDPLEGLVAQGLASNGL